jgi:hypothetical protein
MKGFAYVGIISLAALAASAASGAKPQTFVGIVGDAVCGAKHSMDGDDISCLRTCIRRGSKYDLVVGDKIYVLNLPDQSFADVLDKLAEANSKASVKGEANNDTIDVVSIGPAK